MPPLLFFDFDCYFFSFIGRWTLDALDALYPYGVKIQFRFRLGNHVPDVLVHLQFLFAMKVYDFVCKVGKISWRIIGIGPYDFIESIIF